MRSSPVRQEAHSSPTLRKAGFAVALAFRVIPKKLRFRAAIVFARWLEPLIGRTAAYAVRSRHGADTLRDTSLDLLLMMLTRHGTTFDPVMRLDGAEHMPAAGTGATLFVAPHMNLSMLFIRYLQDSGHAPIIIAADRQLGVRGTRMDARVLCPSPRLLLEVRRAFKNGETVGAMIDRAERERRNSEFEIAGGPLLVSDALLRVALRCNARIRFVAMKMDPLSRIVIHLAAPSSRGVGASEVLADFAAFVDGMHRIEEPSRM